MTFFVLRNTEKFNSGH